MKYGYLMLGLLALAATILAANAALQHSGSYKSQNTAAQLSLNIDTGDRLQEYSIEITKNESAFDILDGVADVQYQQYSFGKFITSINGLSGNQTHGWFFFVDGKPSQVGADSYYPAGNETIGFTYMSFEDSANLSGF